MHDQKPASTLVESFVVTPQKLDMLMKALGYPGAPADFKGVGAWVGYRVHSDEVWKRVKSGELGAFSIEGTAEREEVEKYDDDQPRDDNGRWSGGGGGGGDSEAEGRMASGLAGEEQQWATREGRRIEPTATDSDLNRARTRADELARQDGRPDRGENSSNRGRDDIERLSGDDLRSGRGHEVVNSLFAQGRYHRAYGAIGALHSRLKQLGIMGIAPVAGGSFNARYNQSAPWSRAGSGTAALSGSGRK